MPLVGLGTYRIRDADVVRTVISTAISSGYRMIDTASGYRNEEQISTALEELYCNDTLKIRREDIFIVSKIAPGEQGYDGCIQAVNNIFKRLKVSYIDQILIHWPGRSGIGPTSPEHAEARLETWKALNLLYSLPPLKGQMVLEAVESSKPVEKTAPPDQRLVRSIGVSNFTLAHLQQLQQSQYEMPHVHQFEMHPLYPMTEDGASFHAKEQIQTVAYSPFGEGALVDSRTEEYLPELKRLSVPPARALLKWAMAKNAIVIPKSVNPERIRANFQDANASPLTPEDLAILDSVPASRRRKFTWDPKDVM